MNCSTSPLPIDASLIMRAQLVADGSNIHEVNQLAVAYKVGIELYNIAAGNQKEKDSYLANAQRAENALRVLIRRKQQENLLSLMGQLVAA